MTSRLLGLLAAALLVGGAMSARQDPAPQPAPQGPPPPTFRSLVQVIEVDVRVFDRDGRFVTGLAREDFEVVEEGRPQQVDAIYFVENPARPAALATPDATPAAPTPGPPASPAAPQTWIFIFDLNHLTPGGGFDRARKAVEDFIRDRFRDGDLAGIVAGDKMVNNRLTSVRAELLDAVAQVKPRSDARTRFIELTRDWPRFLNEEEAIRSARNDQDVLRRVVSRACSDDPDACTRGTPEMEVMEKARRLQQGFHRSTLQTLSAVNALSSGLARIPGPKTVVFLSDGFVVQDIETTLRSVAGQTARAGARIYAIDVRGLNRVGTSGIIDQRHAEDPFGAVTTSDSLADGTNSLAVGTGGMMIRNENDIGRALDRVADDSGRYYVLVYQPSNTSLDGSYRPIQVRVKRDGVRVRARRGYLALAPARLLLPQPIVPAVESTSEPAAIGPTPEPEPVPETPSAGPVAPTATGVIVAPPVTSTAAGIRLRPDTEGRVEALSTREPNAASALSAEGWAAYQRGDVETAHAAFVKASAEPGVRPWVLYALGMSQAALGQAANAAASWERVRQAVPDFQPVYMDLADAYAALSDLTSALTTVRLAEARWPASAEVHSAIGVILVRRGALDEGIRSLIRTTELDPRDDLAFLNLGRAYALRYQRNRRYVTSQRRWVAPEADRKHAIEALARCVKLDGPYAVPAKEELTLLEWSKQG